MKKDLQLRYGFSVAIFYLSTVHFSMLNRQFFLRPGKTRQGKQCYYGSSETGYSFQQIRGVHKCNSAFLIMQTFRNNYFRKDVCLVNYRNRSRLFMSFSSRQIPLAARKRKIGMARVKRQDREMMPVSNF